MEEIATRFSRPGCQQHLPDRLPPARARLRRGRCAYTASDTYTASSAPDILIGTAGALSPAAHIARDTTRLAG